jgi:hypothetical protein
VEALVLPSKWGARFAGPVALFSLNAFVTLRLFHSQYIAQMGSIEGAFIGLARYIRDHFSHLSWMPLWYGGIPFPDSYPPLLHFTVAGVSALTHISSGLAYHIVTAVFYSLAPVALYWALGRLGATRSAAFIAAVGYSLFSPTIWLVPSFRRDIGGWFAPCRLDAMVSWGEGPHITALMFLPLAIGALYVAIRRRTPAACFGAALAMAATALSNWIGGFALALAGASFLLANIDGAWLRLGFIACWAYAIAAPFVTPSTVATIQANAPLVAAGGFKPNPVLEAAFAVGALAIGWALSKWKVERPIRVAALFFYFTAGITLPAMWFKLGVIPQPERYHLEMDLAFWLLAGLVASRVRVANPRILIAVGAVICLFAAIHQHRRAQELEKPIDIASTAESEISLWLGAHNAGQRAFAPGTIGFWMQAFSDTPMLTGGFDNGERNTFLPDIIYQIYAGDRQDTMLAWLKAFGIGVIVGGAPNSREVYHPYAHPEKFDGLPEIWRDGPEVIYAVPRRRASLAHAMLPSDLPQERPPAYYAKPLDHYLAALDDPALPDASFTWRGTGSASIAGTFAPEQVLSVQITFDKGWHATVGGEPRPILQDKIGLMVVEPRCSGPCVVELFYDGGIEQQAARWLSAAALLAGIVVVIKERLHK